MDDAGENAAKDWRCLLVLAIGLPPFGLSGPRLWRRRSAIQWVTEALPDMVKLVSVMYVSLRVDSSVLVMCNGGPVFSALLYGPGSGRGVRKGVWCRTACDLLPVVVSACPGAGR